MPSAFKTDMYMQKGSKKNGGGWVGMEGGLGEERFLGGGGVILSHTTFLRQNGIACTRPKKG